MKKLFNKEGREVQIGEKIVSFRGEEYILKGGRPPHKPSSEGFVWVASEGSEGESEYYPSVFQLEWKEVD